METQNKIGRSDTELSEIRAYVEGQMTEAECRAFELKMLDDPFLSDAVDGFTESQNWNELEAIKKDITQKSSTGNGQIIMGSVMILVSIGLFIFWYSARSNEQSQAESPSPVTTENQTPNLQAQHDIATASPEIIDVKSTDSSIAITIEKPLLDNPSLTDNFLSFRERTTLEPIEKIEPELSDSKPNSANPELHKQNTKIYHIRDYKVADYRGLRFAISTQEAPDMSGTPANEGLGAEHPSNHTNKTEIPYVKYLEQAMLEFAKEDYDIAFQKYKVILNTYPDDVNAQFYGGMCAFESGLYQIADNLLMLSGQNSISSFKDESNYYRAKCLIATEKQAEANTILEQIVSGNGFYATKAKLLIKQ